MKTKILILLILATKSIYAQDTIVQQNVIQEQTYPEIEKHTQVFSLSPISKKVNKVNGLVFGIGHVENKRIGSQTINGINLEANPAPIAGAFVAFLAVIYLPEIIKKGNQRDSLGYGKYLKIENMDYSPHLKLNGLNLSTGCFFTTTSMNGLNISLGNKFNNFNGVSITALGTIIDKQNGVSIGIFNANNSLAGTTIGVFNQSYHLKGLHFGVVNYAKTNSGLQIGVFNRCYSKGLQVGLWNVNGKRSLPFLNW